MWALCCILLLCFSLPPRVLVLPVPVPTRNGLCGRGRRKTWLARPGWKCGCLPPSRPDLGGLEEGCGLAEERGRQGLLGAGHRPQPGQMLTHLSQQWLFIGLSPKLRRPGEGVWNPGYENCSQERPSGVGTRVGIQPLQVPH